MKIKFILFVIFIPCLSIAQKGDVEIAKDPRIDGVVSKQSVIIPPAVNPQIDGFRIQIFFDSDRDQINDARNRFVSRFPKVDTYTTYNQPNFILKVGDFRTRLEAEKIKMAIEADFPTSFIVKEKINLPRLDREELPE